MMVAVDYSICSSPLLLLLCVLLLRLLLLLPMSTTTPTPTPPPTTTTADNNFYFYRVGMADDDERNFLRSKFSLTGYSFFLSVLGRFY